jgi:hypothetical protein
MTGHRRWLLSILILFVSSCSNPRYVTGPATLERDSTDKSSECPYRFSGGECLTLNWVTEPTEKTFGEFVFKVFRANLYDGSAVLLPTTARVVLWMPSMSHGSSPVKTDTLDVGTFRATRVFFTMRGEWEIRIQIMNGDQVLSEAIVPVTF